MAGKIKGITIQIDGETKGLDKALKDVNKNSKDLQNELKSVERLLKFDPKNIEATAQKQKLLTEQVTNTTKKLDALKQAQQEVNRQFAAGEISESQYRNFRREIEFTEGSLKNLESQLNQTGKKAEALGNKMKSTGDKMNGVGQSMSMGITLPIVGIGAAAVTTAMNFEAQMDKVGAIAGATADEMKKMEQVALDLGANTSKSASEVSAGMGELAAMGFTVTEIIGAMPGVISAAEASGSDMAQTAEVMASTLNIFGLEAGKANDVADILAKTANISAASLTDMQYALKYAGPPAAALGISLEETAAAIGIMTNAGMKGEQAGTSLRGALLGLLDPSVQNEKMMTAMGVAVTDAEGNFVGLSEMIENLSTAMKGQTDTQKAANLSQLVGKEAVSGMLSLMKAGPSTIDSMTKSLEDSGGASEETAKKMRDNLKGALDELGGTIETAAITIGTTLKPVILEMASLVQGLVDKFQNMSPAGQKIALVVAAIAAAIGPLLIVFGFMASAIGSMISLFGVVSAAIATAGGAAAVFGTVLAALTGPIAIIIAAIVGIIAVFVLAYQKIDWFREGVNNVWNIIKASTLVAFGYIRETINTIVSGVVAFVKTQLDDFKGFWDENGKFILATVKTAFGQIQSNIQLVMGIIKGIFQIAWPLITATVRYAWETIKLVVSTAISLVLGIIQTVMKILQGDWKGAWETILKTVKNIWDAVGRFLDGIDLAGTGRQIIQGLINGLGSMASAVKEKVQGIVSGIKSAITGAMKIKSPSRVTMGYGVNIGQGLVNGIEQMSGRVQNSAQKMAEVANPAAAKVSNTNTPVVTPNNPGNRSLTIQIPLNGQVIAEQTFDVNQLLFGSASKSNAFMNGVR